MSCERIVVDVILLLRRWISPITYVAALVLIPTMSKEFIGGIKSLPTETALWVAFESTLILGAWLIITCPFVLAELLLGEKCMLMRKNLFISNAEITVIG